MNFLYPIARFEIKPINVFRFGTGKDIYVLTVDGSVWAAGRKFEVKSPKKIGLIFFHELSAIFFIPKGNKDKIKTIFFGFYPIFNRSDLLCFLKQTFVDSADHLLAFSLFNSNFVSLLQLIDCLKILNIILNLVGKFDILNIIPIELLKNLLYLNVTLDIGQHHTSITQLLTDKIDLILTFLQISSYK